MTEEDLQKILSKKGYSIVSESRPDRESSAEEASGIKRLVSGKSSFGDGLKGWSAGPKGGGDGKVSDNQPGAGHEPICAPKAAFRYTGKCKVRVKVFRKRLCDPDGNICKWHIDALRYAHLLRDDSAKEMDYYFEGQEKVQSENEERVEITLEYDNAWWE